jgi:U3 small nucleolar RNA-associated protein 15
MYADQLGRSEDVDVLFDTLVKRVREVVDTSQSAISVAGMVDCLTSCAGAATAVEV